MQKMEKLVCLIVARNLGDAVIQSAFLKKLATNGYAKNYVAWVRPQVAFLFNDIPGCQVVCSQFPVGTAKNFGLKNALAFLKAAWRIRQMRPSVTMDLIGDFRERFFALLLGAPKHQYIGWAEGHPFNLIIRNPLGRGQPAFDVPAATPNIYLSYGLFLEHLTGGRESSILAHAQPVQADRLNIGLHPFASQQCKLWPDKNWLALATHLLDDGHGVTVFGAGAEKVALEKIFAPVLSRVTVFTKSLADFTEKVSELDLFIGLDSFGVHMGQRQGVRNILINAGNNPEVWTPPSTVLLAHSGGCQYYPCNNVPKCEGTAAEYICIRSVKPQEVLSAAGLGT